jgi:hypothetical protein
LRGTGHPPDHGKKHQKIYVDKIALFFLCLQDKKSEYESQGVVKKKVFLKIFMETSWLAATDFFYAL